MAEHYVRVATLSQLRPGKMMCVQAEDGRRLLLANVAGTVHAADEMCTHEDAPLCTGSLKSHYVKCPLHGSRFDLLTGQALEDPADEPLRIYPVRIEDDAILVSLTYKQEQS